MIDGELRALRRDRGITREDLALAAGVSMAWLQRLEAGAVPLSTEMAERLAPCLGVTADALLTGHEARRARRKAEALQRVGAA